jgi:arylsulfatase A-like enzyme
MKNRGKPNVIFFMMDQLSAKWLETECFDTPNIDALKKNGVSFNKAYSSNPVCAPARAILATGLASRGNGVLQNGYELDLKIPNFMKALKENGWKTEAFGSYFR